MPISAFYSRINNHDKGTDLEGEKVFANSCLITYRLMNEKPGQFIQNIISKRKENSFVEIELPDNVPKEPLLSILEFLYGGVFVKPLKYSLLMEIINLCDQLELHFINTYISQNLKRHHDLLITQRKRNPACKEAENEGGVRLTSIISDYTLSDLSLNSFSSVNADSIPFDEESQDLSWDSLSPYVERQDGTYVNSVRAQTNSEHNAEFEFYDIDEKASDPAQILYKLHGVKNIEFDFYKLIKRDVHSPEDNDSDDFENGFSKLGTDKSLQTNFSDIVILVENQYIQSYKGILSARGEYFKTMFSGFKEQDKKILEINGVPFKYFSSIHEFLLTGKTCMKRKTCAYLVKLLIYADYFQVKDLVIQAVIHIRQYLNDYTVFDLYLISKTFNVKELTEMCLDYLCFETHGNREISQLQDQFETIVSSNVFKEFKTLLKKTKAQNVVMSGDHYISKSEINPITWDFPQKYKGELSTLISDSMVIGEDDIKTEGMTLTQESESSKTVSQMLQKTNSNLVEDSDEELEDIILSLPKQKIKLENTFNESGKPYLSSSSDDENMHFYSSGADGIRQLQFDSDSDDEFRFAA